LIGQPDHGGYLARDPIVPKVLVELLVLVCIVTTIYNLDVGTWCLPLTYIDYFVPPLCGVIKERPFFYVSRLCLDPFFEIQVHVPNLALFHYENRPILGKFRGVELEKAIFGTVEDCSCSCEFPGGEFKWLGARDPS
jgi:hypothetical protein